MKRADDFRATLTVSHLGAIEHAEIEVRPLTLFFGPNGTNKTWTAYGLYETLRRHHHKGWLFDGLKQVEAVNEVARSLDTVIAESARGPLRWSAKLRDLDAHLPVDRSQELGRRAIASLLALSADKLHPSVQINLRVIQEQGAAHWPDRLHLSIERLSETLYEGRVHEFHGNEPESSLLLSAGWAAERMVRFLLATVARERQMLALPAERKALTVLHESLVALASRSMLATVAVDEMMTDDRPFGLTRATTDRRLLTAADPGRSLPRPSIEFIAFLNTLAHRPGRRFAASESLARRLEESLLGGTIDFTDAHSDALNFTTQGRSIDLHISSSLARAMAGLDLFLRYEATPGSFILIDEPEMNAHPRTQLAIAEFIALMVNHGLRVIATTHSPYIVDHLHNLMEAGRLSPERQQAVAPRFRLGTADAFLDPEQVATWLFTEHGTVENAFDRKHRSIDWQTFSAATDDMANLYSELLIEAGEEADEEADDDDA